MALSRTWYNTLVDDDGSNTVGTIWDKAAVDHLMDDVDLEIARLDTGIAAVDAFTVPTASTVTGTTHNWAPTISGNTLQRWAGAADATFTGLANGVTGCLWTFRNTGSFVAYFAHSSGSSSSGNRFSNIVTSASTPVAPRGFITYQYDGTDWHLVAHNQGAWITPTYAGGSYTSSSGSWTVDSGDVATQAYCLIGRSLTVLFYLTTTSVSGSPTNLVINNGAWGGFTTAKLAGGVFINNDAGAGNAAGPIQIGAAATAIQLIKMAATAYGASTNSTSVFGQFTFEVS